MIKSIMSNYDYFGRTLQFQKERNDLPTNYR